jgi:tRNA threonylcarbamoyl adenosine modification protein YeaZ
MQTGAVSQAVSPTYGLAIHTSSPELGLALSNFAGDSRHQVWDLGREVSNLMHEKLVEFLRPQSWLNLAWIAVAIGPGGFTGTRIGVVAARTLAQQLEIPLFGISSLAAIAQAQKEGVIALEMPVQRGEIATAIYQKLGRHLTCLRPDQVMPVEQWRELRSQQNFPYDLVTAASAQGCYSRSLLEIAQSAWDQGQRPHWSAVMPFYGQHPVVARK